MDDMTIQRAAELCGGKISGEIREGVAEIGGRIEIDSRQIRPGDLFVAYRGERVDGHDYITAALDRGAACCLAERVPAGETRPVIVTDDVQNAVEKIAAAYRAQFDLPVVGITGSVGKTTAKEMVSAVLEQRFRTLKTEGNLNNRIGVPMMLSRLSSEDEAAVIEMGISEFGEMSALAEMVRPTMAVYTVIGHAHLEFLHDLEGVLQAKTEMLDFLPDLAPVIVNGDDPLLSGFLCRQRKITYGFGEGCDVHTGEIISYEDRTECEIVCGARRFGVTVPAFGKHVLSAALAGAAAGMLLGLSDEEIRAGILKFHNVGRRSEVVRTGSVTMIDDSYNANPDSVRCGIDSLMLLPGTRHVCILGDMLELGGESPEMHEEMGRYAAEKGVDLVLTSGDLAVEMSRGAGDRGLHFPSREDLIAALPDRLRAGDCILVKASKGSHFETVAAAVKELNFLLS